MKLTPARICDELIKADLHCHGVRNRCRRFSSTGVPQYGVHVRLLIPGHGGVDSGWLWFNAHEMDHADDAFARQVVGEIRDAVMANARQEEAAYAPG